jgi:type IV pilus assembly protein PilC
MAGSAVFIWEGTDRQGRRSRGEISSPNQSAARAELRRQGITARRLKRKSEGLLARFRAGRIVSADIALFTRQMSTMMRAGVPLVQAFDIVADGAEAILPTRCAGTRSTSMSCSAIWSPPASRPARWKRCWTGSRPTRKSPSR